MAKKKAARQAVTKPVTPRKGKHKCPYKGCGRSFERSLGLTMHVNRVHKKITMPSHEARKKGRPLPSSSRTRGQVNVQEGERPSYPLTFCPCCGHFLVPHVLAATLQQKG